MAFAPQGLLADAGSGCQSSYTRDALQSRRLLHQVGKLRCPLRNGSTESIFVFPSHFVSDNLGTPHIWCVKESGTLSLVCKTMHVAVVKLKASPKTLGKTVVKL